MRRRPRNTNETYDCGGRCIVRARRCLCRRKKEQVCWSAANGRARVSRGYTLLGCSSSRDRTPICREEPASVDQSGMSAVLMPCLATVCRHVNLEPIVSIPNHRPVCDSRVVRVTTGPSLHGQSLAVSQRVTATLFATLASRWRGKSRLWRAINQRDCD